jgi:uncharacterized protein (DUF927 family)
MVYVQIILKGEKIMLDKKVYNAFIEGKLDEEFLDYVKTMLSISSITGELNEVLNLAEIMTFKNPEFTNQKFHKGAYVSALILLLLHNFIAYKSFERQMINEL